MDDEKRARVKEIFESWHTNYNEKAPYHLSEEEAGDVWDIMFGLARGDAELEHLIFLFREINRECTKGLRCGVCGRYSDERCTLEC